ncbi:MAG: aldo/keto reductase [Aquiluna sp.]|nr:aldo/keto reductase [Aquiluna sp.]MCF8545635.1 aldo/keto reductase [Aquiluna sp.]
MNSKRLGKFQVSPIGIGCMNPSWIGGTGLDPVLRYESAIPAFHAAMDAGVNFFDTADIYAPTWDAFGHNEQLIAEALRTWSGTKEQKANIVIATKAGITRKPGEKWGRNASLDYLLRAAEASAGRLGVEKIQLWQHHRLDPSITFEEQFENVLALKERGIVDEIGVSNYDAKQLEIAVKLGGTPDQGGVVSIQNEFSPNYRYDLDVLDVCEKYGIAFLPWSPLGGSKSKGQVSGSSAFEEIGAKHSASPFAIALAWLMHRSETIIPIPGATRVESVLDCVSAIDLKLSQEDFEYLNANLPEQLPYSEELLPKPAHR